MAERGKPLKFAIREEIKTRRENGTVRQVASELSLSKTTVQKYGKKNGTR